MLLRAALSSARRAPSVARTLVQQKRFMAAAGPVGYGSGPYRGIKFSKVQPWHLTAQKVMGTVMWLWLFYRAKNDGPALLGLEHPWEHGGHGHDDHGHGEEEELEIADRGGTRHM